MRTFIFVVSVKIFKINIFYKHRHPDHTFKIGFHALPSMHQLHLHVISTDLVSPHMKKKKHYLSFATDFFIPFEKVLDTLMDASGKIEIKVDENETLLKGDLICHVCRQDMKNMPNLIQHLQAHSSNS